MNDVNSVVNWQEINQLSSCRASNYGHVADEQLLIADELLIHCCYY